MGSSSHRKLLYALVLTLVALAIPLSVFATVPPPTGRTGAPGQSTCSSCHSGGTGTGNVTLSFPNGLTYTPGVTQRVTVTLTDTVARRWSYETTARQASATSTQAGSFAAVGTTTTILTASPYTYAAASSSGTFQTQANSATWQFDWTPPATNVGNVIFYIAALAANNNNSTSGDSVRTANFTLAPAAAAPNLVASPTSLSFAYTQRGTTPAAQTVNITSSGTALNYTISTSATWLSATPASGTTPGSISVSVAPGTLAPGTYTGNVTVTSTGAANSPLNIPVTFTVTAAPNLVASPTSLTFAYQTGGTTPATQNVSVSSSGSALSYTTSASATWITITPASGTTTGTVTVGVNPTGLAAGTYTGNAIITSAAAGNSPLNIPVTLTVTSPNLVASPTSLSFAYQIGGTAPASQTVSITSSGAALSYTTSDSATWLTVTPASGTTPGTVTVAVSTTGLAAGTYTGNVTITSAGAANSPLNIPVTLTVSAQPSIVLSPTSLTYSYQIGGTPPAAQNVSVSSSGSALTVTTSTSATWLTATPTTGTTPRTVSVAVNTTGLAAGTYTGTVTFSATGAANSPQTVPVTLTVTPQPNLVLSPTSLTYSYQIGGTVPAAQSVSVTSSGSALSYTTSTSATWLTATPASGTTPGSVSVGVNTSGLAAGTYTGNVTITSAGAANSPQTVPVTLTVTPAPLPNMTVSPTTLSYSYVTGGTAPAAQNVSVTSSGAAFNYTTSTSATWLTATASGTTPGTVAVGINTTGLAVGSYNGTVTIASTGAANSPQTVAVSLTVTAPATLGVSPTSLSFSYQIGGATPAAQSVSVSSSGSALNYTVSSSATWLSASPASGTTPGSLTVSANPSGLAAGTYNGSVTVTSPGAAGSPQTVAVSLTVAAQSSRPLLTATPSNLAFAFQMGSPMPATQRISVGSSGTSINFRAYVDQPWLQITSAAGPTPGYLDIGVMGMDLMTSGTYTGNVTIDSADASNTPMNIPVTLTVTAAGQTILSVAPTSLAFNFQLGGTAPASQTLTVSGSAGLSYTVSDSATWLTATPATGVTPGAVNVSVNTAGLAAGTYTGTVTVTSPGATGSPQVVSVTLTVSSAPTAATLVVSPKTLTFFYKPGDTAPAPLSLNVTSSGAAISYTSAYYGGSWITVTPAGGTTPGTVNVSASGTGLGAGTYTGNVTLTAPGTAAVVVPVTLIVSSNQLGSGNLDPVPYTYDTTGTAGVSAAWIYGAGLDADQSNQVLMLVKNGASSTDAQAGIHLNGAAGVALTELGFDIRNGQCTASGPHFAVITSDSVAHVIACGAGTQQPSPAAGWQRVRFSLSAATPPIAAGATVNSIDLVLSAGPDSNSGFAILDNIDVNGKLISKP